MKDLITKGIGSRKQDLLIYFRERAVELLNEVRTTYGNSEYKSRASASNQLLIETKNNLIKAVEQKAKKENWSHKELLEAVLMITYTNNVVMLESRHEVWEYEYMSFARRIGELWEPFCLLCWEYPINQSLEYFIPPLFRDVKIKLSKEVEDFIENLKLSDKEKAELKIYYQKVWTLVTSGEVKLELDLHFMDENQLFNVDFKSGFSSNEKGNTNRLLLVASIYKMLEQGHKCQLYVRSSEEKNNHYLQTLKNSGLWEVYCGKETYKEVYKHTQFDLNAWIEANVCWAEDFNGKLYSFLNEKSLLGYLEW